MQKNTLLMLCCAWLSTSVLAQLTISGRDELANGMTRQLMQDPVVLQPHKINQLPAFDAMQTPGIKQFGPQSNLGAKRFWLIDFTGSSTIAWNISVPEAGEYHVVFLVNIKNGKQVKLTGPLNTVVLTAPENGWQRSQAAMPLKLSGGNATLSLQLANGSDTMDIKSVELINVAEEKNIEKRIKAFKGDATWLKDAGYGIMVQVGGWAYPPKGDKKPWPGFAEDFDAKAFVDKVRNMGGKYIVWSAAWIDFLFPAPIKAIADVLPQRVSRRDLLGDIIKECQRYNIKVMMYYHLGHDHKDVLLAKGWKDAPEQDYNSRQQWLKTEEKILTEIGNRYGEGLNAVFLDDGCTWYPADFESLGAAVKAGNPRRLVCYNPWIGANPTPFQNFYCGEGFDGKETPYKIAEGNITAGPQKGLQLFGCSIFDGPDWGNYKPNLVIDPPTNWTADKIVAMTKRLEKERYSVAINLLMYEDGSIGEESYKILMEAAKKLKRGKWTKQ